MPYHALLKQKCVYHCIMTYAIKELIVPIIFFVNMSVFVCELYVFK